MDENDLTPDLLEYKCIKLYDIKANQKLGFDIYIFLPKNDKYVKYIKGSETITESLLLRLKFKNVNELYVKACDVPKYNTYLTETLRSELSRSDISTDEKALALKKHVKNVFATIEAQTGDEDAQTWTQNCILVSKTVIDDIAQESKTLSKTFNKFLNSFSDKPTLANHALLVSSLSAMMGLLLGLQEKKLLADLSLGGLLHDIGFSRLPDYICDKYLNREKMSKEERALFEEHPKKGVEVVYRLLKNTEVSDNVIKIIFEHHENASCTGFPSKLSSARQSYLATIVSLVDHLAMVILHHKEQVDFKILINDLINEDEKKEERVFSKKLTQELKEALKE